MMISSSTLRMPIGARCRRGAGGRIGGVFFRSADPKRLAGSLSNRVS